MRQTFDIEIPNPLNGQPLPGTLIMDVKEVEAESYKVLMHQNIDKEKLTKDAGDKVKDVYTKIGTDDNGVPPIDFQCTYEYLITKGIISRASQVKIISSAESKTIEEFGIK